MRNTLISGTRASGSASTHTRPERNVRGMLRDLTLGHRWWVGLLVGYAITRLFAVAGFIHAGTGKVPWGPDVAYDNGLDAWQLMTIGQDGGWYLEILEHGYPDELPTNVDGEVVQNPWAFYPLFPLAARVLAALPGITTGAAAVAVATIAGLAAVLLLRLFMLTAAPDLSQRRPWFVFAGPLVLAAFPSAGIFSAAYSESSAITVLLAALVMLLKRRYFWLCVLILVAGLARPLAVPIGLVVIVHFWPLVVTRWRRERVVAWRDLGLFVLIGIVSTISVALWPVIAAVVTGIPDALFVTQSAWKRPEGSEASVPFSVWTADLGGVPRAAFALLFLMMLTFLLTQIRGLRPLGPELAAWSIGYLFFILATVSMGNSTPRYLLPMISLHLALASKLSRWWSTAFLLGGLCVLQYLWVAIWFSNPMSP